MTNDTDRPADGAAAPSAAPAAAKTPMTVPRKGFDPASLKGGTHPGGKMLRGTRTMQSAKSRGRG